jgi:hypothetical protein
MSLAASIVAFSIASRSMSCCASLGVHIESVVLFFLLKGKLGP